MRTTGSVDAGTSAPGGPAEPHGGPGSVPGSDAPAPADALASGRAARTDQVLGVMTVGLAAGELMLESSVATSDVELAIRRLVHALGLERCEVTITLNVITMSYLGREIDAPITLVRVVEAHEPRLDRIAAVERLIAAVEAGEVGLDAAAAALEEIDASSPPHSVRVSLLAGLVSAAAWIVFAGGGFTAVCAGLLASLVAQPVVALVRRSRVPQVFGTFTAALFVAAVPHVFLWAGAPIAMTPAIAGGLYPLLPGGALVASVVDGLSGAPLSSMAKGLQALVEALGLALGVLAVLSAADALDVTGPVQVLATPGWVVGVSAALAIAGLSVQRGMPTSAIVPTAAIAVGAWLVPFLAPSADYGTTIATFGGAVLIGVGGQAVGRIQRLSGTIYTSSAVYVLVPGLTIYLSMVAIAGSNVDLGVDLAIQAGRVAAAIAAGIALGSAVGRSVPAPPRARVAFWRPRPHSGDRGRVSLRRRS